ncbi:Gfo/Idh/MocA family protein [Bacillus taeanensis]|uniref:Gfo/Idh/MocA family oxidoreductase n=1 Tax=Bacillus taeanensis TaxID=273032 RepID=A0A366XR97_9BACI|nr:Gfo/Idh/MocA family oxidoreductase [Bacillus taeanensis]RBW68048.1 gfo/Idh/MocA family oxidoreductase [Bacillus taeanensis]
MSKKIINWGILSSAKIAQKAFIPAIHSVKNARLVGIASGSGSAKEVAEEFDIPTVYESYEEMLQDQTIDAVYIPLPNALHAEWVIKAAEAKKHVLCEKPAALTKEETVNMIEVCKGNDVFFMEAFMYQFHPQHERVKEILASGEIGEVKFMRASFSFYIGDASGNIRLNKTLGGGSIYDVGCYGIHAIRNILSVEPKSVYVNGEIDEESGVEISSVGVLEMENGVKASFDCGFDRTFYAHYEIIGTKGTIEVPRAFRPDKQNGEGIISVTDDQGNVREEKVVGHQYSLQIETFSNCIIKNERPVSLEQQTIANMKVIEACYESIETGKKIELSKQ